MLFDWPDEKAELQRQLELAVHRKTRAASPIVLQTPQLILSEGTQADLIYPDGSRTEMKLGRHEYSVRLEPEDIAAGVDVSLRKVIDSLSESMAAGMSRSLYKTLEGASPKTGGTFRGETGEEIVREIIEALKSMDFNFDENGKPDVMITLSPKAWDLVTNFDSPELRLQIEKITEQKRGEWVRRESRRRLVD